MFLYSTRQTKPIIVIIIIIIIIRKEYRLSVFENRVLSRIERPANRGLERST